MSSILDDFQVLEVPRTFSIAEVKIMKNKISFNVMTASELAYPGFIRLFISDDRTQLALQPCEKETMLMSALGWSDRCARCQILR